MLRSIFIISIVLMITLAIINTILWYDFKVGCKDYLMLAGNSPTLALVNSYLKNALNYIENKNLTSGDTAFFIKGTPKNSLGIWYKQIKESQNTVQRLLENPNTSQLERDNAIMKIRETLLETSPDMKVTIPDNISTYPRQTLFLLAWIILIVLFALCIIYKISRY